MLHIGAAAIGVLGFSVLAFLFVANTSPDDLRNLQMPMINISGPDAEEAILATNSFSAAHEGVVRNFVRQGRDIGASERQILRAWNSLAARGITMGTINGSSDREIRSYIRTYMR